MFKRKESPNEMFIRLLTEGPDNTRPNEVASFEGLLKDNLVNGDVEHFITNAPDVEYEGLTIKGAKQLEELIKKRLRWRLLTVCWTAAGWMVGVATALLTVVFSDVVKAIIGLCT